MRVPGVTRCIFCNMRPLTKEDYTPKWMRKHELLEQSFPNTLNYEDIYEKDPATGRLRSIATATAAVVRGDPILHTLEVVCGKCNNGWMSQIQNEAKPILQPMMKGNWPSMGQAESKRLATWAAMRTMVYEFKHPATVAATEIERFHLRIHRQPPANWLICVGLYGPKTNNADWHRGAFFGSDEEYASVGACNVQTTISSLGGLLFHIFSAPTDLTPNPLQYADAFGLSLLWPLHDRPIAQPSFTFITDGVNELARSYWAERGLENPDLPASHGF